MHFPPIFFIRMPSTSTIIILPIKTITINGRDAEKSAWFLLWYDKSTYLPIGIIHIYFFIFNNRYVFCLYFQEHKFVECRLWSALFSLVLKGKYSTQCCDVWPILLGVSKHFLFRLCFKFFFAFSFVHMGFGYTSWVKTLGFDSKFYDWMPFAPLLFFS